MTEPLRSALKIAILLPDLRGGGAERMRIQLAAAWIDLGFDVEFVLLRERGELLPLVPAKATIVGLGVDHMRGAVAPLVRYLRRSRPAVLLAALWPLTVVAIAASRAARAGNRVVVSDHSILSRSYASYGRPHGLLLRASLALGYRFADERIGVSKGVVTDLTQLAHMSGADFHVVYNPAATGVALEASAAPPELAHVVGPLVLSVGALKPVKNHALLLDSFAQVDPALKATLCILGEGALRRSLEAKVRSLGLEDRVLLPGFRADTAAFYRRASVFVLSSDHEGFGNVLVEALQHGVPVVSTDCPSGPREVLADGEYGRLVPLGDARALSQAIAASLVESPDREKLKTRSRAFRVENVARTYLQVMLPNIHIPAPATARAD